MQGEDTVENHVTKTLTFPRSRQHPGKNDAWAINQFFPYLKRLLFFNNANTSLNLPCPIKVSNDHVGSRSYCMPEIKLLRRKRDVLVAPVCVKRCATETDFSRDKQCLVNYIRTLMVGQRSVRIKQTHNNFPLSLHFFIINLWWAH